MLPFDVWFTLELQSLQSTVVTQVMYAVSVVGYMLWSAVAVAAGALPSEERGLMRRFDEQHEARQS